MGRLRFSRARAVEHLRRCCAPLRQAIDALGPLELRVSAERDLFDALAAAIVYQQLSGKAAATIHGRFSALFQDSRPEAAACLRLGYEPLRGAGLSNNKALAVLDLADKTRSGVLSPLSRMGRLDDQAVVDNLCQVRGIGPWTAQMFLIFNLGRPDVMPSTDLGVQKGVQAVYRMRALPGPRQVERRTRHLAPYRSAASWYFWRAADTQLLT
jgi:3-methyladenine DNA glycosylase/8-oxoguanine DNA glycosylase